MMNLDLKGKTAVVGGSSKGIGKAIATELAEMGANVILLARGEKELEAVKETLDTSKDQKHSFYAIDYNDPKGLKDVAEKISEKTQVHILINNTGGPAPGPAHIAAPGDFEKAFRQHLICNQILVSTFLEGMKEAGYGRIINIISTSVKQPIPGLGVSNTIRGAVANWSKTLSLELAQFGITVNNVLPGATNTERLEGIISNKSEKLNLSKEAVTEEMKKEIPAARFAEPRELAYAVSFLASPAAGYINGVNLPVDGGRTGNL